ncbi:MAG: hypothetical protein ACK55Z_33135, partial [bacterium]
MADHRSGSSAAGAARLLSAAPAAHVCAAASSTAGLLSPPASRTAWRARGATCQAACALFWATPPSSSPTPAPAFKPSFGVAHACRVPVGVKSSRVCARAFAGA